MSLAVRTFRTMFSPRSPKKSIHNNKLSNIIIRRVMHQNEAQMTYRCSVLCGRLSSGIWDTAVNQNAEEPWHPTFLPGADDCSPEVEATVVRARSLCRFIIVQLQCAGHRYTPSPITTAACRKTHTTTADGLITTWLDSGNTCHHDDKLHMIFV